MTQLPLWLLSVIFLAAAVLVWGAGSRLVDATDVLDSRLHLSSALGGAVFLAIATNLPEIAVVSAAAEGGQMGVAIGNVLGGIAIQTMVLVGLDAVVRGQPLTRHAASVILVVEAAMVVAVLVVAVMGAQLPAHLYGFRVTPASVLIAIVWLSGLILISRARAVPPSSGGPDRPGRTQRRARERRRGAATRGMPTPRATAMFLGASVATLLAGVALERSGEAIARQLGISGVLFGATFLAAATALPEVTTGWASVRIGDFELAMSDIFGGNAFLPVLFLLADLLSGRAVLPQAGPSDVYLTGLGALLTCVYVAGLALRPRREVFRMGADSFAVLVLYVVGMAGLFTLGR